jgi:transposase
MDIYHNARTTPHSRAALVRRVNGGELSKTVAAGVGVCDKTVRKWAGRFSREGAAGLADRSSRPHRLRRPTAPAFVEQAIALRRQRLLMKHIAAQLELSIATVSRLLKRAGLSRLSALDPPPPIVRYEYAAPGDLLHLDTKKLGRFHRVGSRITGTHQKRSLGAGFEVAHVCIDDHSRPIFWHLVSPLWARRPPQRAGADILLAVFCYSLNGELFAFYCSYIKKLRSTKFRTREVG